MIGCPPHVGAFIIESEAINREQPRPIIGLKLGEVSGAIIGCVI